MRIPQGQEVGNARSVGSTKNRTEIHGLRWVFDANCVGGGQLIFEDSPGCVRHGRKEAPTNCIGCVLMNFVPAEHRAEGIPCRHIPLNATGETLDSLYGYGNAREIEEAVGDWLRTTIDQLEKRPSGGRHAR